MILSGKEIYNNLGENIVIYPFNSKQLNPNSYNLKLHKKLVMYEKYSLDMKEELKTKEIMIPDTGYQIEPGILYLGRTLEYTETNKFIPMLEGRSSIGRLGISIHITAGFGDIGFKGFWTLEISCIQPVIIYPFVEICQIYYHEIKGKYNKYKSGKYQDNKDIQPSLLYKEL